jgi:signal transduction histidine kinase
MTQAKRNGRPGKVVCTCISTSTGLDTPGELMTKEKHSQLKLLLEELNDPHKQLNVVFALTGVIPALTLFYLLCSTLIFHSLPLMDAVPALLLSAIIIFLGYITGYGMIQGILKKTAAYAARAKRSDELKSSFAVSLAHDLKVPLSVIKVNLANFKTEFLGPVTPQQDQILTVCQNVITRMDGILMELIDVHTIESRTAELKIETLDLFEILKSQERECSSLAAQKRISLEMSLPKNPAMVKGDASLLARAFNNLFGNAIKHTPESGKITVKAGSSADFVRVEFLNTGPLIPEDCLEKIFDKFERLDPVLEGQGLGLGIARDIVELHYGKLWAESEKGKPNCFTVLVPLVDGK